MPIEIRELNIKINLSDDGSQAANAGGDANEAQEALVSAVIEKVLAILKEKEER
jgi:hypothetical protein